MLAMATVNSEFNVLSGFDWCLVLGMVVTVINSFVLTVLCLRFRALSMLLVGTKLARAEFIFTQPTLSTAQTSILSADMIWQAIKTALSDLVGLEAIMSLMFILFFVSLLIRIFRTKQATATYQTRLFLYLESANMSVKKHLVDLNYVSDYYCIDLKPIQLCLETFIVFGYIKLQDIITVTHKVTGLKVPLKDKVYILPLELRNVRQLMSNDFYSLLVLSDRDGCHTALVQLNAASGTKINDTATLYPSLTP